MADNPQPKVEMYVKWGCPYCIRAKSVFDRKGVEVTEYEIAGNEERRAEMVERAPGSRTVPQIFIDDRAENVDAALSVGITTFHFDSVGQLEVDLKKVLD